MAAASIFRTEEAESKKYGTNVRENVDRENGSK
jgi:hypothetical protein